jgi:GH35 family endo-1,4-beta-xylanase
MSKLSYYLFSAKAISSLAVAASIAVLLSSTIEAGLDQKAFAAPVVSSQGGYGISIGDVSSLSNAQLNQEFSGIAQLGFNWVRIDFSWDTIQPTSSQGYDWTSPNAVVAAAARYHLQILGILDSAPEWAAANDCVPSSAHQCAPKDPAQFAAFANATASRYQGSVNNWEIWNEENISEFWYPYPDPSSYSQLLVDAYPAIKTANPSATVILGGLADGTTTATQVDSIQYLQDVYNDGATGYFDAVGYHPYTFPSNPLEPSTGWSEMNSTSPSIRSVMDANGDSSKLIWITEYGAPTDGPDQSQYVDDVSQAQMVLYSYLALANQPGMGPFFWYTYQDSGTSTTTNQNFFGIVRANGSHKLAYRIWRQILQ